jgi:hypothetical protein
MVKKKPAADDKVLSIKMDAEFHRRLTTATAWVGMSMKDFIESACKREVDKILGQMAAEVMAQKDHSD